MDLRSPEIILSQFSDSHNYINTLTKLNIYEPTEVLLQRTTSESELSLLVRNKFRSELVLLARKYFSETKGAVYIKDLGFQDSKEVESSKYLALASVAGK
jgi:DNA mismatch repair protein MSH4